MEIIEMVAIGFGVVIVLLLIAITIGVVIVSENISSLYTQIYNVSQKANEIEHLLSWKKIDVNMSSYDTIAVSIMSDYSKDK